LDQVSRPAHDGRLYRRRAERPKEHGEGDASGESTLDILGIKVGGMF
jgi:hypothetical protein